MKAALFALGIAAAAATGCSAVDPARLAADPEWSVVEALPVRLQDGETDCGAAALAMILARWGRGEEACATLASQSAAEGGIRAGALRDLARAEGLEAFVVQGTLEDLREELAQGHPVLVGLVLGQGKRRVSHYEVVAGMSASGRELLLADPACGWRRLDWDRFLQEWEDAGRVALVVFPRSC